MKLLLDTHIWIWAESGSPSLGRMVKEALLEGRNQLWLSPISTWELVFLFERKRLDLNTEPRAWAREALRKTLYQEAPISHEVALESHLVDLPHRDPADRILAATAMIYGLTLVTADVDLLKCKGLSTMPNR